jgi:hypothetical protein
MNIAQIPVQTAHGAPMLLGAAFDRPTIVILARYYG